MLKSSSAWIALMSERPLRSRTRPDHVKQTAVQTLDELQGFEVERTDRISRILIRRCGPLAGRGLIMVLPLVCRRDLFCFLLTLGPP